MKYARDSRCFSKKQSLKPATASGMIGSLIVRSYEQSERVYLAMLARGYDDTD
jgi:energy-coupling factor transporter transmembrane protein EcfT